MPKFTVVIPLYNKEHFIAETLQSVLDQSFRDFEVIVVNDGSTDGSLRIINTIQEARLKIINQDNQGLSTSRNTGIHLAKGSIIALLDADDLWHKDHLQTLDELATSFPEASFYGTGYQELYSNGKTVNPRYNLNSSDKFPGIVDDFFLKSLNQPLVHPSSVAFTKEMALAINCFDPNITYTEDVDFYIRANLKYCFAYTPEPSALYRMDSENQITKSGYSTKKIADFDKYLNENPTNKNLHKYINNERYFLTINYKTENNSRLFKEMRDKLNLDLLTKKQHFLLQCPRTILLLLKWGKKKLLLTGHRFTSF